jgi:hypothetical protein
VVFGKFSTKSGGFMLLTLLLGERSGGRGADRRGRPRRVRARVGGGLRWAARPRPPVHQPGGGVAGGVEAARVQPRAGVHGGAVLVRGEGARLRGGDQGVRMGWRGRREGHVYFLPKYDSDLAAKELAVVADFVRRC